MLLPLSPLNPASLTGGFSFGVVCGGGAGTQGLMSARQMLYRQARSPALHNTLKRVIGR